MEETGLRLKNIQYKTVVNAVELDKNYHYIDLFMTGELDLDYKAEPENMEPHKSEGTIKFLNFGMPEIFAVIYLKFKQRGQTLKGILSKWCKWNSKQ